MSLGMRIASLLGAAALTAAVVTFVDRWWGVLPLWGQVTALTAAPLAATALMIVAGRLERTRYVASIFAIIATGAFVFQTIQLSQTLGLRGSPHALAAWALFAIAIAWPWRFVIPFAFGVGAGAAYIPAVTLWVFGFAYTGFLDHPEPLLISTPLLLTVVPRLPVEFRMPARSVLLVLTLVPLLILTASDDLGLLDGNETLIRTAYQVLAVAAAVAVLSIGIRHEQRETVLIGAMFAAFFLLIRFVDWWWDWMPKYLFFLIVGAIAIGWLWALRLVRGRLGTAT